jgi:molybdopterin converting factor small subunit
VFQVKVKIQDLLIQNNPKRSTGFEVVSVPANEGESVLELLRRLADHNEELTHVASYVSGQDGDMPAVIILNGRLLALHEIPGVTLKEGDEVTVLPLTDGG